MKSILSLSGVNTFTGPLNVNAGKLILNKTISGDLAAGTKLGFGGGILQILGNSSGATTQTVASIDLNAGGLGTLAILPNGGDSTALTNTGGAVVTLSFSARNTMNSALITEGAKKLELAFTNPNSGVNLFNLATAATAASALASGSWLIENAASLPGAYGSNFTVVGWNDEGDDTWTKTVGLKNDTFNELDGTVSMVEVSGDAYTIWIDGFTPNALLPHAASKHSTTDPDNYGITNLMEFVLGNGNPVVSSQSILPTQATVGPIVVLNYKRNDDSESPATEQIGQWSTDLASWNDVTPVLVNENGAAPDDMTVTVATSNEAAGKLFLRLKAVK